MPTLGEACQQLRIGRVTLAKWIKRLGIETTRHEWDYRFEVIAPEDVERIADARRKLPAAQRGVAIPSYNSLAFDRRQSERVMASDASPTVRQTPRQRPLQRGSLSRLPDGMMDVTTAGRLHGVPRSTLAAWVRDGRIETDSGEYGSEGGRWPIVRPLTRRGLAQLVALAHGREGWRDCPLCPHEEDTFRDTGGDTAAAR